MLQDQWSEAAHNRDAATLNSLLSDYLVVVTPIGKLNKAQCVDELTRGDLTLESITCEEAVVRDYGAEAVVSGIANVKGQYKGRDISGQFRYRWSQLYLKLPGRWQILTGQLTETSRQ